MCLTSRSHLTTSQDLIIMSHFHPGPDIHVSPPSRSHLNSQPDQDNCISVPSRSHLTTSQDLIIMSHLQPGLDIHVSPFNSHLTPIYIPQNASQFHPGPIWSHPGPKVCVSPPSRPHLTPIHIARFASHPHPGSTSSASRTQDLHLSFISVMSPLLSVRQDCNSPASRSHLTPSWFLNLCLTSIQYMSHPHPGPDIRVTSSFRSHLVSIQVLIQVPRMASHSMQVPSQLTQDTRLLFHLHPSNTSPEFGSQDSRFILTSFYVTFHRYTGPKIHASPLSRSRLTSSTFSTSFVTHLHPVCVSLPSRTWFKCIKVPICTHPLHWCCISHPSRSWEEHLNSIQITSLTHLGLQMCISPPSRSRLTSVQIPIFVSRLHTGRISPPFRSWRLHLSFIQVPSHPPSMSGDMCLTSVHFMSHFHSSHQNCTAAPSRLTSIQAPGFVFHLQPVVSRSQEFHFISIQLPFQPHTHLKMCV